MDSSAESALPPLLGPGDPPAVEVLNPQGRAQLIFVSDHASRAIPRALGTLGLDAAALDQHIAWDIGIAEVTRRIAERLHAPAILAGYSRLVIDCNRRLDDPTSIVEISDETTIPGNLNLSAEARRARQTACFHPFHKAIVAAIEAVHARGLVPALVSMHSFTPVMSGFERPWHIGLLWNNDPRMRDRVHAELAVDSALTIGDNEPYSARAAQGYTIARHAEAAGLPHIMIELRQDLIGRDSGIIAWADRLGDMFKRLLAEPALFTVQRF
jgi:predicted N-formylglutamate amidohydrolase